MMVGVIMVDEVWDLLEREVLKTIARNTASQGANAATVALHVELAAQVLRERREFYLAETALWIESELAQAEFNIPKGNNDPTVLH